MPEVMMGSVQAQGTAPLLPFLGKPGRRISVVTSSLCSISLAIAFPRDPGTAHYSPSCQDRLTDDETKKDESFIEYPSTCTPFQGITKKEGFEISTFGIHMMQHILVAVVSAATQKTWTLVPSNANELSRRGPATTARLGSTRRLLGAFALLPVMHWPWCVDIP